MKIYLIFDKAKQPLMTIQEAYDARVKFSEFARSTGKMFTYDLLAGEPSNLYRAGAIFDETKELDSLPMSNEIRRDLGIGPCIDLSKLPPEQVDRDTFLFNPSEK